MRRLSSILLWSVISAAFIGPGTVTSASSAGASHGLALLWALVFSTVACLVLQEASARLTIVSGHTLGGALRRRYPRGVAGAAMLVLVVGAVVLGCAAYQAGNILGGVAGAVLALPWSPSAVTLAMVAIAALLLWHNSPRRVAVLLSALVAVMGVAFLWTAIRLTPDPRALAEGALVPSLPEGSALLAMALVGTTVVPYNLFLGSGLASGQLLGEMRLGLALSVLLGGVISIGVLVVGTAVEPPLEFDALAAVLAERLGPWARHLFALGLFSAGLSSAVTAPLAAAMTARSLIPPARSAGAGAVDERWHDRSWRFRGVWMAVLAVGLAFGLSGIQPVSVIIVAQALNGILLPVVALFLLVVVNDRKLLGGAVNRVTSNALMAGVTLVALLLGVWNVLRASAAAVGVDPPGVGMVIGITALAALAIGPLAARSMVRGRR